MNTILEYIEKTALLHPSNIAIDDGAELTYADFRNSYSAVGTHILQKYPEASNRAVVVFLPKSAASVVAFMGALASGNAYVPVDYKTPVTRLMVMLEKLNPLLIITDSEGMAVIGEKYADLTVTYADIVSTAPDFELISNKLDGVIDTDPAYVMFTSGSTGVPKGVTISHRGIENYAKWLIKDFEIDESSCLGLQSGFHFDNSVFDMYTSFLTGAKLVIIPETLFMYPPQLMEFMKEKRVTCIFWVPTVMINVANSGALDNIDLPDLKTITFAGEVMPNKQLNIWRRALPGRKYANLYGPTEITVDCTFYVVDRDFADDEPLPIGYPVPNTKILLIDENNNPVPKGEKGELCVVGCGLALGYWNDPETTDKVFVQNPLNTKYPEPMYKTGDLAYIAEDGLIMYSGRKDYQIKLRGNRIEMGDIENAAIGVAGIKSACALFDSKNEEIILFIVSDTEYILRKFNLLLGKTLPKYMLPGKLVQLESFPLTPNKKIDRKKLMEIYETER